VVERYQDAEKAGNCRVKYPDTRAT